VHEDRVWLVKDIRYAHPLYRFTLGRFLLWRESVHYGRLQGLSFIPRSLGRLDADALVLEYIAAPSLGELRSWQVSPELADRLRRLWRERYGRHRSAVAQRAGSSLP
jgi:hypothetical protein